MLTPEQRERLEGMLEYAVDGQRALDDQEAIRAVLAYVGELEAENKSLHSAIGTAADIMTRIVANHDKPYVLNEINNELAKLLGAHG